MDNPYADRLSPREKEEFASVVRDFEKVWRSPVDHSAADLAAVVERFPANGVLHAALRVELAAIDLGQRLAQDRPASVAAYLEALPGLTGDEIAVRYLIARDYLFHLHRDPNRSPEEHARAFPEQGPELLDALRSAQQSFLDGVEQEAVTHGPFSTALPSDGPRLTAEDKIALPEAPGYKVLDELGAGGMGVVYKSIHLPLNRVVALKMIRVAASREDVARFRGEAEAAARLRHPNIVTVYEVGDFASRDGQPRPYLAMEFLEGGSLAQKLAGRPLPPHQAAELLEALARAVQHAHEARVVHRDLKPGNVLFDSTGQPRVADFGLARLLDRDVQQTGSGAVLGTPSYMAPEQASGRSRKAGPAADVYSLGAILYECLTGRPPFTGATVMDVLQQVLADDPIPPHNLAPKTPRDLETITLKCLNKEPERRYGSARELADDLARFLRGARVLAHPPSLGYRLAKFARRYRGPLSVTAAVLLTAVVGVAAAFVQITAALGRETRAREEADGLRVEAEGKEKQALESLAKEQKALADLKQQFSVVARSYSEISDLEFRRGDVPNSLNWLLQAYETAPAGDPLRPTYRTLLAVQGRSGVRLLRHRDLVLTSAFSPDGRLVLTGSSDHTAQLWETATGRPLATLKHEGGVESVAFSPDGQRVLTASEDKTARLWDAPSGKLIAVLRHQGKVKGVAFSPDGRLALTRSADQTARLWESAGGRESATLRHEGDVNAADFSPDGRLVLTASEDKSAKLWETASGKPRATFRHQGGVRTAAFSPDGRLVLTSSSDLTAGLGETDTGKRIVTLKHEGSLLRPLFSPDGRLLLTGAGPNLAQLWEAATGKPVAVLRHDDVIRDAAFSPNGRAVITGSYDRTARVWLAQTGEHYATLRHEGWVTAVAFSPDRRLALTCDGGNLSKLWDVFTGRLLATRRNHGLVFGGRVSFSPDGRLALTWTLGNTALLWDVVGGAQPVAVLRHAGAVSQVAFSPDGRLALTGGQDKIVHVRDAATGRTLARLEHEAVVNRAAFSPNSQLVVTASRDKKARLWETATGKLRATLPHDDQVKDAAFSPDGRVVATGGEDKKARLWDSSTGKLRATLPHGGAVAKTVFSPDGKLVLIRGDTDQSARLQEVASGKLVAALEHKGVVWSVAFSPDSRLVLTGSQDQTARLWETATGKLIATLTHDDRVEVVAFSPDGRVILTASYDKTARLWETDTGKLRAVLRHDNWVVGASFSPDGRLIATAAYDQTARLWETATGKAVATLPHDRMVGQAIFSPDGRLVLTTSLGQAARLWETATGKLLATFRHENTMRAVAFSPNGRLVLTGSEDKSARLWEATVEPAPDDRDRLRAWVRARTWKTFDSAGTLRDLSLEEWRREWDKLDAAGGEWQPPHDAKRWHRAQADAAELVNDSFAALFHLKRLVIFEGDNADLRKRRGLCYLQLGRWLEALDDYSRVIEKDPDDVAARHGRATVRAEMGEWKEAIEDWRRACGQSSADVNAWFGLAMAYLHQGDAGVYRDHCRRMSERFAASRDPEVIDLVVWSGVLVPSSAKDGQPWLRLAEGLVDPTRRVYLPRRLLGAARFRAGNLEGARTALKEALDLHQQGGAVADWLLLAMIEHRLGNPAEARKWLDKAVQWAEGRAGKTTRPRTAPLSWQQRIQYQALRREAEKTIGQAGNERDG